MLNSPMLCATSFMGFQRRAVLLLIQSVNSQKRQSMWTDRDVLTDPVIIHCNLLQTEVFGDNEKQNELMETLKHEQNHI